MSCLVYRRPAAKPRVFITTELRNRVLAALATGASQQAVARQLGIAQATVSKIAKQQENGK